MTDPAVVLETRDLTRHFGGLRAVEGVSLQIRAGHIHSLIGPNGAGKTTLFNLLSGIIKPTRGQVLLRGHDITPLPPHRRAHRGLGRSYQITNLFPSLTVFENVRLAAQALGRDNFRLFTPANQFPRYDEEARRALEEIGLARHAHTLALALSHGDKRKLELAMLLAQDPEILLLDEPTAGLAAELIPDFMALVGRIRDKGNKTIVLVEHNMNVVMSMSDRISVMHQGQLLAEGKPDEIAASPAVKQAYMGAVYGRTI